MIKTANLQDAAQKISWGKWQNCGQVCIAPDYLFAHEDIKEELVKQLEIASRKIYGREESYGKIINTSHFKRISEIMDDAQENGAIVEFGGEKNLDQLRFSPTILSNIAEESRILKEEVFGPIMPILTYTKLDDVISFINKKPKPLALYLFSKSKKTIHSIQSATSSGMLTINDTVLQFGHPHLPIGGVNNSGIGKSHGHAGFLAFTNEKAVLKQPSRFTIAKLVYPPYSSLKRLIIHIMIKYL